MIDIEKIADFIRGRPKVFILAAAIVAACLLLIVVISLAFSSRTDDAENAAAQSADAIPPSEFFYPGEPLPTPGIQLSRELEPSWSEEEAARWFIPPSKDDLNELRLLGEESVTRLLEEIP